MIIVAKTAGFCFGVRRAVDMVQERIDAGDDIYMLGPVIHNRQVIEDMTSRGAKLVRDIEQIAARGAKVVIRAHGAARSVYEELERRGLSYIDTTCPFVKKIHGIVTQQHERGRQIIIIGDSKHPEVIGINGWCDNSALVFAKEEEIAKHLDNRQNCGIIEDNTCIVAQTTIDREIWGLCVNRIKKVCTNAIVFDTICNATNDRQKESVDIARKSDAMIVIGGRESSNTLKLVEVCKRYCTHVTHIESPGELSDAPMKRFVTIGITAGASTPAFIIREVQKKMDEIKNDAVVSAQNPPVEEMSFAEAFEQSFVTLNTGDVVTGEIVRITDNEIQLNLGTKHDGYIPLGELSYDPDVKMDDFKVGDKIEAFVVRVNDVDGVITLSRKKIDSLKSWEEIENACENGDVLSGVVADAIKGGLIVNIKGVRVFVPASLAAERYTEDLKSLVGKKVNLKIIEINKQRKRVTGSIRVVLEQQRKSAAEKVWNEIEIGSVYQGVVKSIMSYGVFVDIGGVDGMVHISELAWTRVRHPSEVVKIGDIIEVVVTNIDRESKKISLSYKKQSENPWEAFKAKYSVGDTVSCRIIKMMPFGAFAQIMPGVDGLIHISQISERRIAKPEDVLLLEQNVDAKITDIDFETKKISLSIKALTQVIPDAPSEDNAADAPDEIVASTDNMQALAESDDAPQE